MEMVLLNLHLVDWEVPYTSDVMPFPFSPLCTRCTCEGVGWGTHIPLGKSRGAICCGEVVRKRSNGANIITMLHKEIRCGFVFGSVLFATCQAVRRQTNLGDNNVFYDLGLAPIGP